MKKNTILVIMTLLVVLGWMISMAEILSSFAGPVATVPQTSPGTTNLQSPAPNDLRQADSSPQAGIPAAAKPSATRVDAKPITEPCIILP